MPTYDFLCRPCGNHVTVTTSMDQLQVPTCLGCVSPMTRDYNFAKVTFKGQGFYSNDKKETD